MPIDPKKFKKIVTNHFDNLSEEEFLKTLNKSSTHLSGESLGVERDVPMSEKSDLQSKSAKKTRKKYS